MVKQGRNVSEDEKNRQKERKERREEYVGKKGKREEEDQMSGDSLRRWTEGQGR
jgi:hypothetical protein